MPMRHLLLPVLAGITLAACSDDPAAPDAAADSRPVVTPACATPAPLEGQRPAQVIGYIVLMHPRVDVTAEAARLGARYGFTPRIMADELRAFAIAPVPDAVIAALRCEPFVRLIEYDQRATIAR